MVGILEGGGDGGGVLVGGTVEGEDPDGEYSGMWAMGGNSIEGESSRARGP
jgi:hypothetical protein